MSITHSLAMCCCKLGGRPLDGGPLKDLAGENSWAGWMEEAGPDETAERSTTTLLP